MIRPPTPADEELRLAALEKYHVLDTPPEIAYDDIAFLASQICGTPIAAISLIDRDRQWFKSKVGFDVAETPREVAFCAHAIVDPSRSLIVEDAREDDRFRQNPLVTGDFAIRFYAGAPLVTSEGHALGTLCVIDREPRRFTEKARQALEVLSREVVSQLELRWALRELDRSRRQQLEHKDQFLSHVSHELRTPLTVIFQFVSILLDGLGGDLTPTQREYLGIVDRNAKQLRRMIGDLIEVTRVQSGKIELDRTAVDLHHVVSDVLLSFQVSAALHDISLTSNVDASSLPFVYADPTRLTQILTNLVDNGLKFSAKGGTIAISASSHPENVNFVRVSVADSGCGIAVEECDRIFDQLYQIQDVRPQARKGLGLGLHICKDLVSRHGGEIWAESDPGRGTTFHFTLPVISLLDFISQTLSENKDTSIAVSLLGIEFLVSDDLAVDSVGDLMYQAWLTVEGRLSPANLLLPGSYRIGSTHRLFVLVLGEPPREEELVSDLVDWVASVRDGEAPVVHIQTKTHELPAVAADDRTDPCGSLADAVVRTIHEQLVGEVTPEVIPR